MPPSSPEPLDVVVRAFLAAMARKDFDVALANVADECEYENVPLAKVRGPAGVRAVLEPFFAPTLEKAFAQNA